MDHMEYLGNSLKEIAYEKVGIVNNNSKLITSVKPKTIKTIRKYCLENSTEVFELNNNQWTTKRLYP